MIEGSFIEMNKAK